MLSYEKKVRLFHMAWELSVVSDGSTVRTSSAFIHPPGQKQLTVDAPDGVNESLLVNFTLAGSDLDYVIDPVTEGRLVDIRRRLLAANFRLLETKEEDGRKLQGIRYRLEDRGTGLSKQITLWIDVRSGLPAGRDVVGDWGPEGRVVSSHTYHVILDASLPPRSSG